MVNLNDILNAKILIVDDQEANVRLLEQMLRAAGYVSIASTRNSSEVCALYLKHRYDLILLDIQMPNMDGFKVMEALKEIEQSGYLPVLVITAQPLHKLRALRVGARDFISKPFELAEVLARVHNLLEVRLLHEAVCNHSKMLELLALNDPLTGLANRRLLADRMSIALIQARRNCNALAVICLDLDGFKQINDTLGHGAGDLLLKIVAKRMVGTVREGDTVARLGGDEFAILLWHVSGAEDAAAVAAKVIESVSRPCVLDGSPAVITVSAGISLYPIHGADAKTLMKNADLALYDAKHAGRNTFRFSTCETMSGARGDE